MFIATHFLPLALLVSSIQAATTTIQVGATGVAFTPNSATAAVGDVLEFHFYPANHSVVQGVYSNPCAPSSDTAFYSGFVPTESGEAVGHSFVASKETFILEWCVVVCGGWVLALLWYGVL